MLLEFTIIEVWWRQPELQDVQSSSKTVVNNKPTPNCLQSGCPSCLPTNSGKAQKGKFSSHLQTQTRS